LTVKERFSSNFECWVSFGLVSPASYRFKVQILLGVLLFFLHYFYIRSLTNFPADICLPLHSIVQCKTENSARFSSLHALCHAFAVSYKMNIQIGLIMETTELICNFSFSLFSISFSLCFNFFFSSFIFEKVL